MGTEYGHTLK